MNTHLTLYQQNDKGQIEKIEIIEGEVVEESQEPKTRWEWAFSFFSGFAKSPKPQSPKPPSDGNGMFYNASTDTWEYPPSNVSPFEVNYNPPRDHQGTVCEWDGYNGE